MKKSSQYNELLREFSFDGVKVTESLDKIVRDLTFAGCSPSKPFPNSSGGSQESIVKEAESLRRRGKINESLFLFRNVLRTDRIDIGCWICCVVGIIQCLKSLENPKIALDYCERFLNDSTLTPEHRSLLLKSKGDILSDLGRYQEAHDVYESSLGIARSKKLICLQAMTLNNIGVNHFRAEEYDEAEDIWQKSRRFAKSNDVSWAKVMSEINLADIKGRRGNYYMARKYLREARKFMFLVGDMEGVSEVDFNLALVCVEEGKKDRAIHYFKRSENFPLMYREKIIERREELKKRFEEKGWDCKSCIFLNTPP